MRLLVGALLVGLALPASAETKRLAIVVGNNAGDPANPILHYAETDAGKLADVLVELGGIDPQDLLLLQGRSLEQLRDAFAVAQRRVAEWHRQPDARVSLLFYFSGHSDGQSLELGRDRLSYVDLKRALKESGAEVRVAIVDSCHSGALLTSKGATLSPAFDIHLHDDLTSKGEAFLTSSAAGELALESSEIRGSFFTHHLVSGLRGAADTSGDGRVTLAEAYDYAFAHTVSATSATGIGPQHPAYDYRLSGEGELVLSELNRSGASVVLPSGFDRALLTDLRRDRVVAELVPGSADRLVVPAGEYAVEAWRGGQAEGGRFDLAEGATRDIAWTDLAPLSASGGEAKGSAELVASPPPAGPDLEVGAGVAHGVATSLGPVPSLRIGLRPNGHAGWLASLEGATGTGADFRETSGLLFAGYAGVWHLGDLQLLLGGEVGGGVIVQALDGGHSGASAAGALSPVAGASYLLASVVSLTVEGNCPAALVQLGDKAGIVWLPGVWLGIRATL